MLWLLRVPWGEWLLLGIGLTFVCYGAFLLTKARYRRIELRFG